LPGTQAARLQACIARSNVYKKMKMNKKEWRNRGYLPHFDSSGTTQFVTFRLADSMPQSILQRWRDELERGDVTDVDFRKRIESFLDQNLGSCVLR
jgi:hypothetical protein